MTVEPQSNFNIFSHVAGHTAVAALIADATARDPKFSMRRFAKKVQLGAPNALQRAADPTSSIRDGTARKIARGFGLNTLETRYFVQLCGLDRANNEVQRTYRRNKMREIRAISDNDNASSDNYEYLADRGALVIRELLLTYPAGLPSTEIGQHIVPAMNVKEVKSSLATLARMDLVHVHNDRWIAEPESVVTPDHLPSEGVRQYHRNMLSLGLRAIDDLPEHERVLGGITKAISANKRAKLVAFLAQQRNELFEWLEDDEDQPDQVVQISYQCFPHTNTKDEREGDL